MSHSHLHSHLPLRVPDSNKSDVTRRQQDARLLFPAYNQTRTASCKKSTMHQVSSSLIRSRVTIQMKAME